MITHIGYMMFGLSLIFNHLGGFNAVYISTVILAIFMGLLLYLVNKKLSKNSLISFLMTLLQMEVLNAYIAARAQLVTFILFILTIYFIEKFIEKPNIFLGLALLIIPILIANIHSAVFLFYFVLFLPYIGEFICSELFDKEKWRKIFARIRKKEYVTKTVKKEDNKIILEKNKNILYLILVMCIAVFTGFLTPIGDMPYTYTVKLISGNTTNFVTEHLPLVLRDSTFLLFTMAIFIGILAFSKTKIKLRDLFFIGGLTYLAIASKRQVSMLVIFGGFVFTRVITDFLKYKFPKLLEDLENYFATFIGQILVTMIVFIIAFEKFTKQIDHPFVNSSEYPIEASKWIKSNLNSETTRLFNDYNYGSYLLYEDIKVFIDSRCDLYTPEFNGEYNAATRKYDGRDIFSDYINVSTIGTWYENVFEKYNVTHVIAKTNSKLAMLLSYDKDYKEIYRDNNFIIYERNK